MLLIAPQVIGDKLWPTLCGGNKETMIHSQKNLFGWEMPRIFSGDIIIFFKKKLAPLVP